MNKLLESNKMESIPPVIVRPYKASDRPFVRDIACQTAFWGENRALIFDDDELLADVLTAYFTDYEPESCFVAECAGRVVGYVMGTRDNRKVSQRMNAQIIPGLLIKAFWRGVFFRSTNWRLAVHAFKSWIKNEFAVPGFGREYPALLHINLDKAYRRNHIGQKLMTQYLTYLRQSGVAAVHLATMSESAKNFFLKHGFRVLWSRRRTYLHYALGADFIAYIMGMTLS